MMLEVLDFDDMKIDEDKLQKLYRLLKDLEVFKNRIISVDYNYYQADFFNIMNEFWQYVREYSDYETISYFKKTKEFVELSNFFRSKDLYYERAQETKESLYITSNILNDNKNLLEVSKNRFISENFLSVQKELELLNLRNAKSIAMVGCGPLPETILYLAENTDFEKIVGIDANQEAVVMAGEIVQYFGLEGRVHIECEFGEKFDYADFDVVHIATTTFNKENILYQAAETSKDNVQILVRTPHLLTCLISEDIQSFPNYLFKVKEEVGFGEMIRRALVFEKFNY